MSREEDLIRSTTRAIASTVHEVPPLQLDQAADELSFPARAPRGLRAPQPRRWGTWLIPVTAAAAVVALAISLVIVKNFPNGPASLRNSAASTTGATATPGNSTNASTTDADVVPRYYVGLRQIAGNTANGTQRDGITVGDAITGQTLATFSPPARTTFQSVSAAADDRTFVVLAMTSSTGYFEDYPQDYPFANGTTLTVRWFEVRLSPGATDPARLIPLPIAVQTLVRPGAVFASLNAAGLAMTVSAALSASGKELAVAEMTASGGMEVKVLSTATGALLHEWTTNNPSLSLPKGASLAKETAGLEDAKLTWIDGDSVLALNTISVAKPESPGTIDDTMRELNIGGAADGDLVADGKLVWNVQRETYEFPNACSTNLLVSSEGNTYSCASLVAHGSSLQAAFLTYPMAVSAGTSGGGMTDYEAPPGELRDGAGAVDFLLWASPSGAAVIGGWTFDDSAKTGISGLRIGVMSHGKFTPLRFPTDIMQTQKGEPPTLADIVF